MTKMVPAPEDRTIAQGDRNSGQAGDSDTIDRKMGQMQRQLVG
jgi:hypothetical protein